MTQRRDGVIRRLATAALILLAGVSPPMGWASSLEVTEFASMGGTHGLKVNVAPSGCSPDDLVIDSPALISGDFEACNTITARNVQVFVPGATFTTGQSIMLENGFSVGVTAPFTARLSDVLGTPFAYLEDVSPDGEDGFEARFFLSLTGLTLGATDRLEILNGYSADGEVQFKLIVKRNVSPAENRLVLAVRRNDGSMVETPFGQEQLLGLIVSDIWVQWSAGGGDGYLVASVNGAAATGLTGLTNSNSRIDAIRFGAVGGDLDPATEGFFYLDEFTSQRLFDLTEAPCVVPNDGSGTGEFPPLECAYMSPTGDYRISTGLPAETEIVLEPIHREFLCVREGCGEPGGTLGGEMETFNQTLVVKAVGTGTLAGYERLLNLSGTATTYTAPRTPGETFATEMYQMIAGAESGDPDFDVLAIYAGVGASIPNYPPLERSLGATTMTLQPSGDFEVDSFFDITYQIIFQGAQGSVLEGLGTPLLTPSEGSLQITAFDDPLPIFADGFESGDVSAWSSSLP